MERTGDSWQRRRTERVKTQMVYRRVMVAIVVVTAASAWTAYRYLTTPRLTEELRGYALAEELGCHGCHGPRGTGGVPNPRSEDVEIPSWDGGTPMMYAENEAEIREWIMDGFPKRLAHEHEPHGHDHGADSAEASLPIRMPSFRSVIDERQLDDLVAYFKVVARWDAFPEAAQSGYREAASAGCFGCHGPGGLIGATNPKSFKGYIPPWYGRDFNDLVENDEELRAWILDGAIERLESNLVARFFTRRQLIRMPAYRDVLSDEQVDVIVTYIQWLSKEEAR